MASLSTCHLGLLLGWQILLNLVKDSNPPSDTLIDSYLTSVLRFDGQVMDDPSILQLVMLIA